MGRWMVGFFVVSGFCSLLYEVVWLRLAMAQFGVTAAMTSIVLSVFMAGLAVGSWLAGWLADRIPGSRGMLIAYGLAEAVIAVSGLVMPRLLALGRTLLGVSGPDGVAWGSLAFHAASGAWTALAMLPFCACMGATFPLAMGALRRLGSGRESFSRLYVANVVGATAGTLATAFVLIELFGFTTALHTAAALNTGLAAAALSLSRLVPRGTGQAAGEPPRPAAADARLRWVLFATGFISLGLEVVWIRLLTPYLGTVVYAFAIVLGIYLGATFLGSAAYRRLARRGASVARLGPPLALLFALALLPLGLTDPRAFNPDSVSLLTRLAIALGIAPFCAVVGFVTPLVVDHWSQGEPRAAGTAYALNVLGCILGPLLAGFILLPVVGERGALPLLAAPLLVLSVSFGGRRGLRWALGAAVAGALLLVSTRDFATRYPGAVVRRDSTATVVAYGEGRAKRLLVNGVGITYLTPITKMMSHVPLALLPRSPERGLVVCFGMGTSARSMHSWGIDTTTVELVPSIPPLAGFFHANGETMLRSPKLRVVVDDGRRFLDRATGTYDAIVIDPPPPLEAAGSSLLYSREFYAAARRRLAVDGILQQWIPIVPDSDAVSVGAFVLALRAAFPFVRAYVSVEGWGTHLLASGRPLPRVSAEEAAGRLPARATRDLMEWGPYRHPVAQFGAVLLREVPLETLTRSATALGPLRDDHPVNEYYLLRRLWQRRAARNQPAPAD